MYLPKLRVYFPLRAHQLLESDILVVELAQQPQLVYGIVQKSSIRAGVLIGVEGLVFTLHLAAEVEFRDYVVLPFEELQDRVHATLGLADL
jgi:hypothetical protein